MIYKLTIDYVSPYFLDVIPYTVDCPEGTSILDACEKSGYEFIDRRAWSTCVAKIVKGSVDQAKQILDEKYVANGFISIRAKPLSDCTIILHQEECYQINAS